MNTKVHINLKLLKATVCLLSMLAFLLYQLHIESSLAKCSSRSVHHKKSFIYAQFSEDNSYLLEFHANFFVVKDLDVNDLLFQEQCQAVCA